MQKNQAIFLENQIVKIIRKKLEENEILEIKHSEDEIEEVGIEISTEKLVRLLNEQQQYTHI